MTTWPSVLKENVTRHNIRPVFAIHTKNRLPASLDFSYFFHVIWSLTSTPYGTNYMTFLSQWMTCKFSCPLFWSYLSTFVDIVLHFWKKFRLPRSTSASGHTTRTPSCCNWSLWIGIQLAFSLQTPLQNGYLRFGPAVIQLFSFTL